MKKFMFPCVIILTSFAFAQSSALTESWIVDKSFIKDKVYKVSAGKNIYEAFAISLLLLAEELQRTEQEIQPNTAFVNKTSVLHSFGKTSIQYFKKGFTEHINVKDSATYQSTQTLTIKVQFSDGKRRATIRFYDEVLDKSSDESFSLSKYFTISNTERTLDYVFQEMSFSDLLNDLKAEGVEVHFTNQQSMTFVLITYPLSKVKR